MHNTTLSLRDHLDWWENLNERDKNELITRYISNDFTTLADIQYIRKKYKEEINKAKEEWNSYNLGFRYELRCILYPNVKKELTDIQIRYVCQLVNSVEILKQKI